LLYNSGRILVQENPGMKMSIMKPTPSVKIISEVASLHTN